MTRRQQCPAYKLAANGEFKFSLKKNILISCKIFCKNKDETLSSCRESRTCRSFAFSRTGFTNCQVRNIVFPRWGNSNNKILYITPLPAQISAYNFHDLTQITQRRVCFNPKRTEKHKAHGFSVRFGLKHTLRKVEQVELVQVVVLIANITLRRGVI